MTTAHRQNSAQVGQGSYSRSRATDDERCFYSSYWYFFALLCSPESNESRSLSAGWPSVLSLIWVRLAPTGANSLQRWNLPPISSLHFCALGFYCAWSGESRSAGSLLLCQPDDPLLGVDTRHHLGRQGDDSLAHGSSFSRSFGHCSSSIGKSFGAVCCGVGL